MYKLIENGIELKRGTTADCYNEKIKIERERKKPLKDWDVKRV